MPTVLTDGGGAAPAPSLQFDSSSGGVVGGDSDAAAKSMTAAAVADTAVQPLAAAVRYDGGDSLRDVPASIESDQVGAECAVKLGAVEYDRLEKGVLP